MSCISTRTALCSRQTTRLLTSAVRHDPLPSIAPKININIKHIRQNPDLHAKNCTDRNYRNQAQYPFEIVKYFEQWQSLQRNGRALREKNNKIRTKLSHAKTFSGRDVEDESAPQDRASILEEARELKAKLLEFEIEEEALVAELERLAAELPNLTSDETPIGKDASIVGYINEHPQPESSTSDKIWRNHVHIGTELDLLDFAAAATTSGWGWYYLKNEAALLEQALVQYALSIAIKHGFTVMSPPSMVYSHIAAACGFHPRDQNDEQQTYAIQQPTRDLEKLKPEHILAATAEIPFAGLKADTVLDESSLPLRIIGPSRCYRAEAGARGLDTKGLYRVHEFTKVEMFGWTLPNKDSANELFITMLAIQTEILRSLHLHCRILEMPTADLGASACRKQDIETFFPSRRARNDGWGEVTSTSLCTDYQTRRLNTRVRVGTGAKGTLQGDLEYPFTVNGTAVAVPRVVAALLENGWDEREGCVRVPEVLWPWMHGVQVIRKRR